MIATPPVDLQNVIAGGIVVLTGGPERLDKAIIIFKQGKAKRMLISGVNKSVSADVLLRKYNIALPLIACCIELGYDARDTYGNAIEAGQWTARNQIETLIVVTADYHMPRSILELQQVNNQLTIIPLMVPTNISAKALFAEFAKYMVVLTRYYGSKLIHMIT